MQHAAVAMMALRWVQMLFPTVPGELSQTCFPCCRSNSPAFVTVPGKCLCIPCPEVSFFPHYSTLPDKHVFSVQQRLQGSDRLKHSGMKIRRFTAISLFLRGKAEKRLHESCLLFVTLHLWCMWSNKSRPWLKWPSVMLLCNDVVLLSNVITSWNKPDSQPQALRCRQARLAVYAVAKRMVTIVQADSILRWRFNTVHVIGCVCETFCWLCSLDLSGTRAAGNEKITGSSDRKAKGFWRSGFWRHLIQCLVTVDLLTWCWGHPEAVNRRPVGSWLIMWAVYTAHLVFHSFSHLLA